jgi:hypothetical protein
MGIVIIALMIDILLIKFYSFSTTSQSNSSFRVTVFLALGCICAITQYLILRFVKNTSKQIRGMKRLYLDPIHKTVTIVQSVLISIFVFVILDVIVTSSYSLVMILAVVGISYSMGIMMLGLLAQRFFSWFKSNRNPVVLLYGVSSLALAINTLFTLALVTVILSELPGHITAHIVQSYAPFIARGSALETLNYLNIVCTVASFTITWVATVFVLRHFSKAMGRTKFWIILSIPLSYFLTQFLPLFSNLFSQTETIYFLYTMFFTLSKPIGGILFGIAFWTAARSLRRNSIVKDYMIISAFGLVLLFVSNQAIVFVNEPYPPFGLMTISFLGLSSYLLLIGTYYSAVSVAQDSKLRQSIRNLAIKESKFLDSIGSAQMEQEILRRVVTLAKQNKSRMLEESGIGSSLTDEDAKIYLEQILAEVHQAKKT